METSPGLKTCRILFGIFAMLPFAMLMDALTLHPASYGAGSLGEMAYLVFGVPILTFNFWAWMDPEIIGFYFLGPEKVN